MQSSFYFLVCLSLCPVCAGVVGAAPIRCTAARRKLPGGRDLIFTSSIAVSSRGNLAFRSPHGKVDAATLLTVARLRKPQSRPPPYKRELSSPYSQYYPRNTTFATGFGIFAALLLVNRSSTYPNWRARRNLAAGEVRSP